MDILPKASLPALALVAVLLLPACEEKPDDSATPPTDEDADGYAAEDDCDDQDPDVHPAAEEVCNGVDDDCDGVIDGDEAVDAPSWYRDADGDGYGDSELGKLACEAPSGHVADATDCDDASDAVHPGAVEVCDGLDNDCDGTVDGESAQDASSWYPDGDGDGYGDPNQPTTACDAPSDHVSDASDCDDTDALVNPAQDEVFYDGVDQDCDGGSDYDADGDGEDHWSFGGGDCDDEDPAVHPGAEEAWDGVDNDCDMLVDEDTLISLAVADAKLVGEASLDYAGCSVDGVGDVDGDGWDDLVIGAYREDTAGSSAGAAYLVLGPLSGEGELAKAAAKLTGQDASEYSGWAVSGAGDMDGDGLADIAIGAKGYDGGYGAVYLLMGPVSDAGDLGMSDAVVTGVYGSDNVGQAIDGGWDHDGDGFDDLFVGTEGGSHGSAYLFRGPLSGSQQVSEADAVFEDSVAGSQRVGGTLAGGGDLDGDGQLDLLIGGDTVGLSQEGMVYGVYGPTSGSYDLAHADVLLEGDAGSYAGNAVAFAGDVNADGFDDVLVGDAWYEAWGSAAGRAYLVLGPATHVTKLSYADAVLIGSGGDSAGESVAGVGDLDADGRDEIAIGASGAEGWGAAGTVYVLRGPVSGSIDLSSSDAVIDGESKPDAAGKSVASAGDQDGDGVDDLLIGAYWADDAGVAYVVYAASF